jgi:hypothetical protein
MKPSLIPAPTIGAISIIAISSASLLSVYAGNDSDSPWEVRFSGNTLFNVSATFKGHPQKPTLTSSQDQPGAANYDNGYVGRDISNDPNNSTYWGYQHTGQQILSGGSVTGLNFERTTALANPSSPSTDADPSFGGEITLRRRFVEWEGISFGLELGASYNKIDIQDTSAYLNAGQRTGTSYAFPSPIDVNLFPVAGYHGPFNGVGPVINPNPIPGQSMNVPNATTVTGLREVEADVFGFRFGPYIELPITKNITLSFSSGALLMVVSDHVTWDQTLDVSTATEQGYWHGSTSASDSSAGVTAGFYVGSDLSFSFNESWSIFAGIRFQDAGTYKHDIGNGQMDLNLGQAYSVNLGLSYSF